MFSSQKSNDDDSSNDVTHEFDFVKVMASCLSEFVATTFLIIASERIGRVQIGRFAYAFTAVAVLIFCRTGSLAAGFCSRLAMVVAVNNTWVHTPELYGTEIRSTGHSMCSACSRVGALISPFFVYSFGVEEVRELKTQSQAARIAPACTSIPDPPPP